MSNQVVWNGKSILVNKISSKITEEAMVKKANEFGLVKGIITIGKKGKEWSAKLDFDNHEQAVKGLNALNHLNMEGGSELNAQPFLEGAAKEQVKGNNLVIKGFSEEVNSKELQAAFETFGQIFSLVLMKPQKIGYVQFFNASDKANILQKQDSSGGMLELHCGNKLEKIVLEEFYEKKDQGNTHRQGFNQQNSRQNQQNAEYNNNNSQGQLQNDNTIVIFGKNYSEVPVADEQVGQFQRSIEQGLRKVVEIVRQELSDLQLEYFVQYNFENKNFWSHLFGNGSKQIFARVLEIANRELRQSFPACQLSFKKNTRQEQVPTAARLICFGIRENVSIKQIHQWLESTAEKAGISSENVRCKLVHKKSKQGQNQQHKSNQDNDNDGGDDDDYDEEGNLNQSYSSVSNSGEDRSSSSSHSQKQQYLDTESQVLYISFPSEVEGEIFLKKCSEISILPESIFNKPKIVPLLPESQRNNLKKHHQHMQNYNNSNNNRPHHHHSNYSNNTQNHNNHNNYSNNQSNYQNNANFNNNSRKNVPENYNNSNNNQQFNNYQNNNNTSYQNHNSSHQHQQQQTHYNQHPNQQGRNRNQNNQNSQSFDGQGYNNGNNSGQQFQQSQYQNNGKYKYAQTGYNNNNQHYNGNSNNNNQQYNDSQNANYQPHNRQNTRQHNNNNNGNNNYQNANNSNNNNNKTYSGRPIQQTNHNEQINANYNKGQPKHNQQVAYQSKNQVQNGKNQSNQYQGQQGVVQQQQSINQQNNRQNDNAVISTNNNQSNQLNSMQTNVNSNNNNNNPGLSFQQLLQDTLKNSQNKQQAEILRQEVISRKREFLQVEDKSMKEQIIQVIIKSLIINLKEFPETVAKILKLPSTAEAQKSVDSYVNLIDSMCPLFANAFPVEEVIQIMEQQDKLILKCDFFAKFKNS